MPIAASHHAPSAPPARPSLAFVAMGLVLGTAGWAAVNLIQGGSLRAMFAPARSETAPASAPEPPRTFTIDSRAQPPQAEFWLDGAKLDTGRLRRELPRDGAPHELKVIAEGYAPTTLLFVDAAPPALITLEKLAASPPPAAPLPRVEPRTEPRTEPASDPADPRRPPPRARRPLPPKTPAEPPPPPPAPAPAPGTGAPTGAAGETKPAAPRVQIIERATPNVQVIE